MLNANVMVTPKAPKPLAKMREISSAVSALKRIERFIPTLLRHDNADIDKIRDIAADIEHQAASVLRTEIISMRTEDIIRNASSIAFYAKKLGLKK